MLAVYGSSVSTAEYKDWQRQRKIVGAAFNENTNKFVWAESIVQAKDMLAAWTKPGDAGIQGTASDTRTLSLDVLAAAGFKKSYKFYTSTETNSDASVSRDYRQSLKIVMDNSIFMMLAPPKLLALPFVPKKWNQIAQATQDFRDYMMDMYRTEVDLIRQGKPSSGNLMASFVQASEAGASSTSVEKTGGPKALTISEILGNVFVINFAGHDTTANTLAYAIMLLAAHPEIQDWIREEIECVFGKSSVDTRNYEDAFPRLKRLQAILLETIRIFPPIMALPKHTTTSSQPLKIGGKTITIPPRTFIAPSLLAVQIHPRFWGDDALSWNPKRWIVTPQQQQQQRQQQPPPPSTSPSDSPLLLKIQQEELFTPRPGTYFPWSDGPQFCPGKKFAQVEFVAVMAVLFQNHRVSPVPLHLSSSEGTEQETDQQRYKRAMDVCQDSEHVLLLRMKDGDSIRLMWEDVRR